MLASTLTAETDLALHFVLVERKGTASRVLNRLYSACQKAESARVKAAANQEGLIARMLADLNREISRLVAGVSLDDTGHAELEEKRVQIVSVHGAMFEVQPASEWPEVLNDLATVA